MVLLITAIVIAVACLLGVLKMKRARSNNGLAFVSWGVLLTPAERSFMVVLEQALGGRYQVFGKVRLADVVKPEKGLTPSQMAAAQNEINRKHVDFVICRATDLSVLGVVMLDNTSHGGNDRVERDEFVDRALATARIPVVHFQTRNGYDLQEMRAKLAAVLPTFRKPVGASLTGETAEPAQPATAER